MQIESQVRGHFLRDQTLPPSLRGFQTPGSRGKAEKLASSNLGIRKLKPRLNLCLSLLPSSFSRALPTLGSQQG